MMASDAEQLERLLSEQADGDLDAAQQECIRRALAEDAAAAVTAHRYARLHELLATWRTLPEGIDWDVAAREVSLRVSQAGEDAELRPTSRSGMEMAAGEGSQSTDGEERTLDDRTLNDRAPDDRTLNDRAPDDRAVDDLVTRAAEPLPEVDWDAFKARVSAAVRQEAATSAVPAQGAQYRWRRGAAWALRVGSPLAAAAVIAFAVWGPWADQPLVQGPRVGGRPLVVVSLERPDSAGRVSVTLDVVPVAFVDESVPPRGGVAIAIGPAGMEELDLLDQAIFY
jgi:hypothetical protein